MKKLILALLLANFYFLANAQQQSIKLKDGTTITAYAHIQDQAAPSVLLLHQCNRDQRMWQPLIERLHKQGYNTLTVDMRGYGESTSDTYDISKAYDESREMEDRQKDYDHVTHHFKNDINDINAFWREKLPASKSRVVIGASCGGAQATKSAALNEDIKAMVVISPSLRPHWIAPDHKEAIKQRTNLPILAFASEEDTNALTSIQYLFDQSKSKDSQMMVYKGGLHGEPLFAHDPKLTQYITDWLLKVID